MNETWQLSNATIMIGNEIRKVSGLVISEGLIKKIIEEENDDDLLTINLHGLFVFPGLINSHDSLLASYHSFQGDHPHLNWLSWDTELKASSLFRERMMLDPVDLYQLGAYKNLISGTSTVIDHIPEFVRRPFLENLPIHLLADYGIAHSVCSYSLNWGEGIESEHARAVNNNLPFIIHIAEGFDPESRNSLQNLKKLGALTEHTVLIHGLSLSEKDWDDIAAAGSSVIWCPVSNLFLYNRTLNFQHALERGINVCLGTDSAMAGGRNLFANMQKAHALLLEAGWSSDEARMQVYSMVTENARKAFRLAERGKIAESSKADLLVLKGLYPSDPYQSLIDGKAEQIVLLVKDGLPVFGDASMESVFTHSGQFFDRIQIGGNQKIIHRGLKNLLETVSIATATQPEFEFLPVQVI